MRKCYLEFSVGATPAGKGLRRCCEPLCSRGSTPFPGRERSVPGRREPVTRCGGARDKRACILMRMLGRLELAGGWNHTAKHIADVQNILADGISRWPRSTLADKVKEQTDSSDRYEQNMGVQNILADGIPWWPGSILADKVREQTDSSDWYEQNTERSGSGIFDIVLQTKNIRSQHDDMLWNLTRNEAEHG